MGVTSAELGVLLRMGIGASQMWTNGVGAPNPTSGGAVLNRVRLELYPSVTGSTTMRSTGACAALHSPRSS